MYRISTNENQAEILKNECGTSAWFDLNRRESGRSVPNLGNNDSPNWERVSKDQETGDR